MAVKEAQAPGVGPALFFGTWHIVKGRYLLILTKTRLLSLIDKVGMCFLSSVAEGVGRLPHQGLARSSGTAVVLARYVWPWRMVPVSRPAIAVSTVLVVALCVVAAHYMIATGQAPQGAEAIAAPPVSQPGTDAPSKTQQTTQTGPTADVTPEATREIAARFLGCEPAALKLAPRQPEPKTYPWGSIKEVAWTGHCALGDFPAADIEIQVDRVGAYVTSVQWQHQDKAGASAAPTTSITATQAAAAAYKLISRNGGLPLEEKSIKVRGNEAEGAGAFFCQGAGSYPDGRRFMVFVNVLAEGGRPLAYSCVTLPPEPAPKSAVQITRADAERIVADRARTRRELENIRTKVVRLSTATCYGDPGTPVYEVELRADVVSQGRPDMRADYYDIWAVSAITGELLPPPAAARSSATGTTPKPDK
jgi:hypothetical protein